MNIIHFIEKLPILELELIEHVALPYMVILYLIDVYCTVRMARSFNEPIWPCFIPFFNWKVVFKHCWNLKAFYEHLVIELLGLAIPFICEEVLEHETLEFILSIIDIIVACFGLKHGIEIGIFTMKSYGLDVKKNFIFIFLFDIVLIKAVHRKYLGNMSHEHHGA